MDFYISNTKEKVMTDTLDIEQEIEMRSNASFVVKDIDNTKDFEQGEPVRIEENSNVIFKGYISKNDKQPLTHNDNYIHRIDVKGMHYLADKRIIAFYENNITCGDVARKIVDDKLVEEGVTYTAESIEDGPTLVEAVSNYQKCSRILDKLVELARNFWWRIDNDKVLHFRSIASLDAPWVLTKSDIIGKPKVKSGNPKYRNVQHVDGAVDRTEQQVETRTGDGENRAFTLKFPVIETPTIEVDRGSGFVEEEVSAKGSDEGSPWSWEVGSDTIGHNDDEVVLSSTDKVKITYIGEYRIRPIIERGVAVEQRKTIEGDTSGKVDKVMSDPDLTDRDATINEAESLLDKYAQESTTLSYTTRKEGLSPGMLQEVTELTALNIAENEKMLVTKVSTYDQSAIIYYDVELVKGPQHESWSKFFDRVTDNIEKAFRVGLSDDAILLLIKAFEENLEISDSLTIDTNAYETRINYAKSSFGEISKNSNMIGITDSYVEFTSRRNIEGLTGATDTNYNTVNVGGITDTFNTDYGDLNIIGMTEPTEAIGSQWVWVEGVSSPY